MNQTIIRQRAQDEVDRIAAQNNGRVDPGNVVALAADESNPMHDYFEWDNEIGGHQNRLNQARALIRGIKVVVQSSNVEVSAVAYVRDPQCDNKDSGYVSVSKVRTEEDSAREVMLAEFMRVKGALTRAREIATALDMKEDVDSFIAQLDLMKIKVSEARQ